LESAPDDIVERFASLMRLRDGTEFEGEKIAAENAIAKLLLKYPDLDETIARAAEQARREAQAAKEAEERARAAAARTQRWGGGEHGRLHEEAQAHFSAEFVNGTVRPPGSWHGSVEEASTFGKKGSIQVGTGQYQYGSWNKKW
jgi:hypothetical protein